METEVNWYLKGEVDFSKENIKMADILFYGNLNENVEILNECLKSAESRSEVHYDVYPISNLDKSKIKDGKLNGAGEYEEFYIVRLQTDIQMDSLTRLSDYDNFHIVKGWNPDGMLNI